MKTLDQIQDEAPILKVTVDLYREFYEYLKTFPKKDQYLLGKRCEGHILLFMELLLSAIALDKSRKLKVLEEANNKLNILKVLFRMARELKMLDNKKYLSLKKKFKTSGDNSAVGYDLYNKGVPQRTPL